MKDRGWSWSVRGPGGERIDATHAVFPVGSTSTLTVDSRKPFPEGLVPGELHARGGLLMFRNGVRVTGISDPIVRLDEEGRWTVAAGGEELGSGLEVFILSDVFVDADRTSGRWKARGTMSVTPEWAVRIGEPGAIGTIIGLVTIEAPMTGGDETGAIADVLSGADDPWSSSVLAATSGPDVIVGDLHDVDSYGRTGLEPISAFSVGTTSCNLGDQPISWFANTAEHPVIAQNMYRLKDGRFEQIGLSWLKHGFLAVTGNNCLLGCVPPPLGGSQLGVGCSDPYSASLNGQQSNLGPRSVVNPHTGVHVYPFSAPPAQAVIGRRLQVHDVDLDPSLNPGAIYFVEGHYVTPDDAAAGNQNNNASYRRATITDDGFQYTLGLSGIIRRRKAAIHAWRELDSSVVTTDIQVPDEGLFILAAKVSDLGNGFWRYEYALQNLNSDRAAGLFKVPVDVGATVVNLGFHDVDHHSGEPYSGVDWTPFVLNGYIHWTTESYFANQNANALRWGTLYNFRFDADVPPATLTAEIELFKPGSPATVSGLTVAPATPPPQCGNQVVEAGEQCDPPDGVLCNGACQTIVNDPIRGGLLWDRWWTVVDQPPPGGVHSLYPPVGQQSGPDTYRCVECHGWDFAGADGVYGSGPHFTGIGGVLNTGLTPVTMFDLIRDDVGTGAHGFQSLGLSDQDVRDLVQFLLDGVVDTSAYINGQGAFLGDPGQGQTGYASGTSPSCVTCHGADGTAINFGTPLSPEWIGTEAVGNPWEMFHKVRFGSPGSSMPSWLQNGGTDQGVADLGRFAQLNFPQVCQTNAHCDDGQFCNGPESCDAGTCLPGAVPCPLQPCGELNDECGVADPLRGGLLFDTWWEVVEFPAPAGFHPLYPLGGQQSGSTTFRCVECHGWDYKGVDGAYGSGPHATGIGGVFGSGLSTAAMFDLIQQDTLPDGHGYGALGLSDNDAYDLVAFVQSLVIDTDAYIDGDGAFLGDEVAGAMNYTSGGSIACLVCHGPDGTDLNFGTPAEPEWVGTVGTLDPWRLLHNIRLGNPTGPMPSWLAAGGTDQGAADLGRHIQESFPIDCLDAGYCDDGLFCTGVESCVDGLCSAGADPCPGQACDESIPACLSGTCPAPAVVGAGSRYLLITPDPGTPGTVAFVVYGQSEFPQVTCLERYVQADGRLDSTPVFQTPFQWGQAAVSDHEIIPATGYSVRMDCGVAGFPDLSFAVSVSTTKWGDVNGNGLANFADINLIVRAFQGDFSLAPLAATDLEPCLPNGLANFGDINAAVQAFQGRSFSLLACDPTCP